VAQVFESLRIRFPMGSFAFFIELILGLDQPVTEMSTRDVSWGEGKGGRWVELTTLTLSCADCLEILGASTSWSPKGLSGPQWESFTSTLCGKFITQHSAP
jgi:hypothetical protein